MNRLWYHLSHEDDANMINKSYFVYKVLNEEEKSDIRENIISTHNICSGFNRLRGHRLWMELLVYDYLYGDNFYEIYFYTPEEIEQICAVWFFEIWSTSKYYEYYDYKKRS